MKIEFFEEKILEEKLSYAAMVSKYRDKWVFVKDKERQKWEIPAGTREPNEGINDTAKRELYEETGALDYKLQHITDYSLNIDDEISYGRLFFSRIESIGELPDYEIEEIIFEKEIPKDLEENYIQITLFNKAKEFIENKLV